MDVYAEIKKKISGMAFAQASCRLFAATVTKVEGETCRIEIDGTEFSGVRLRAVTDGKPEMVMCVPREGSYVLCADMSNDFTQMTVIACAETEAVNIHTGDTVIVIDGDGIVVNGGSLGGLVKADALTQKINAVENRCNDILAALQSVTVALAPSGAFPLAPYFTMPPLLPSEKLYFENEKIKQ